MTTKYCDRKTLPPVKKIMLHLTPGNAENVTINHTHRKAVWLYNSLYITAAKTVKYC